MNSDCKVWARLRDVQVVQFRSESRTGTGWQGAGSGIVRVSAPSPDILVFDESGSWKQQDKGDIRFTNVFRWTILADRIRLEHLRFGLPNPVLLFEMAPDASGEWHETSPHMCKQDCYTATLRIEDERLFLHWVVRGPTRDETISYVYI